MEEIESSGLEMQMTTNIARMPSFNPLGNIFSKTLPALIPTGWLHRVISKTCSNNVFQSNISG